jgi:DNA-binding Xre family transcriptional regulator
LLIVTRFDELRRAKAARENRDLPLRTIAEETALALSTVHRFKSGQLEGVRISTLETLCRYFGVKSIAELIEYTPEGQAA